MPLRKSQYDKLDFSRWLEYNSQAESNNEEEYFKSRSLYGMVENDKERPRTYIFRKEPRERTTDYGYRTVEEKFWNRGKRIPLNNVPRIPAQDSGTAGEYRQRGLTVRHLPLRQQVCKTIGKCCKLQCESLEVNWSLGNYFSLSDTEMYESPYFSCMNASWYLKLCLSSETRHSIGWAGIYLLRRDSGPPVTAELTLGLKMGNGQKCEELHFKQTFLLNYSYGVDEFVPRWKLEKRKSDLVPCGVLTFFCCLKQCHTKVGSSMYQSTSDLRRFSMDNYNDGQADIAVKNSVNVSTQTEASELNTRTVNQNSCEIQATTSEGITQLQSKFKEMLVSEKQTDITLNVKGREFHAHRFVLAAQSPVFMAMMDHEMKEKITGTVDIDDTDPDSFPDFLHYLYTGCLQNPTSENVPSLYETADKYQVEDLKKTCLMRMINCISTENFCDLMSLSLQYHEKELIEMATKFFVENSMQIVVTTKWQMFLRNSPDASNELLIKLIQAKIQ